MKVIPLVGTHNVYSSNVYLICGEWNRLEDRNTLVDVGNDPSILDTIEKLNTGVGKSKVEQVILTHNHSDHTGILPLVKRVFHPRVYAFSPFLEGVDRVLKHGDTIRMGESMFNVFHTPGHSSDSISLYNREEGLLFVGDTQVLVRTANGTYGREYYQFLKGICRENIQIIYPGHGQPLTQNPQEILNMTLRNVHQGVRDAFRG